MKKILYVDTHKEFVQDLQMEYLLEIEIDYELLCIDSIVKISNSVNIFKPDLIVLAYDMLIQQDAWNIDGIPIAYCGRNRDELYAGAAYGYKTIGITESIEILLEKLSKEPYAVSVPEKETPVKQEPVEEKRMEETAVIEETTKDMSPEKEGKEQEEKKPFQKNEALFQRKELETLEEEDYFGLPDIEEIIKKEPVKEPVTREDVIEKGFHQDLNGKKKKTKVVTVYSAKGGVGKTTIATELAVYLSLVTLGRRKLRVCIIDYNIDFGDVRATLSVDADGRNLTYWAAEVQEYRREGMKEIRYGREDMERWMYHDEKSGLYVVSAPLTNEESMTIESDDLKVILDNIIENGEFDFVICDTGNNTRDSTMIALERADIIFLIMTQNINTANCDKGFLETMKTIDFDLSNIRLIINSIMPARATSITVQEIIDFFPYECVGKIKFHTDVIKAANLGEPLAFQPDHEITKQMRSLVKYLLDDNEFEMEKKKKSFWDFLRRK